MSKFTYYLLGAYCALFSVLLSSCEEEFETINYYTVDFEVLGEGGYHVESQEIKEAETAVKPEGFILDGYSFDGWYTEKECTSYWDFDNQIFCDMSLYAQWIINTYSVSFSSNGEVISIQNKDYNTAVERPTDPTYTGYTFDDWYGDSEFNTAWDFANLITQDTTLYANWNINSYDVSFSSKGEIIDTQSTVYNTATKEPEDPTLTGYSFDAWYVDSEFQTEWTFTNLITSDTTLYANWLTNAYKVSFSSNGEVIYTQNTEYDTATKEPEDPTLTGFTFDAWYIDSEFNTEWKFTNLITCDTTLYANWDINSYDVSFSSNGEVISSQSTVYNMATKEPEDPTRTGYTFDDWYGDSEFKTAWNFANLITQDTTIYANWNINSYDVSFSSNDKIIYTQSTEYNSVTKEPEDPTLTGYSFDAWYVDSEFQTEWKFTNLITCDTTLYANWLTNAYKVSFSSNGEVIDTQNTEYNMATKEPEDPTRTGYTFDAWYGDSEFNTAWDFDNLITQDTTIYANWNINSYNVSFSSNDKIIYTQSTEYNSVTKEPEDPTRTGYTFDDWYGDSEFSTAWNFANLITQDTTLYANWNINSYTVSFSSNDEIIYTQSKDYNTMASEPNDPTRTGFTFDAWYGDSEFNTAWDFDNLITQDTTIYAKWYTNPKVTFNSNDGSDVESQTLTYNTAAKTPEDPTRTGYTFLGWYGDSEFSTAWNFANLITQDTTLYANWNINSYDVSFSSNGEVISTQSTEYNSVTKEPEDPTLTGYSFDAWYVDSEFQTEWKFTNLITCDTTLYANWNINSYDVSFSSNGDVIDTQSTVYNMATKEPSDPERDGFTFGGWYADSEFNTAWDFDNLITSTTTIYAKWYTNPKVTFNSNDGSDVESQTLTYNTAAKTPVDPTRTGYTFLGWYKDSSLTEIWDFDTKITIDTTLYAKWISTNSNIEDLGVDAGW